MNRILGVHSAPPPHWVGDGFPMRSLFNYSGLGRHLSPFLLLDHAPPTRFEPGTKQRGVGQHPHRGFETVTIVYQGEVAHRDSTGAGGIIGPGDVQWMTAGAGIVHEELHSQAFTRRGGSIEMVQLWVNLPAADKMTAPGYQTLLAAQIPVVDLADGAGQVRVIAGEFDGQRGPARSFTPMAVFDLRIRQGASARLPSRDGWTLALVVLHGTVMVNGQAIAREGQLVHLDRSGGEVTIQANSDAGILWLSGEPINEPLVGHGPFVMNSQAEIIQAIQDYNAGRFGQVAD
ncbi:MAG: pirin family protein [Xanthomonadales bacterium]|nr:pirin family protein [Xanthomonadales bacterium]